MSETPQPSGPYGPPPARPPHPRGSDGFFDSIRRIGVVRTPDRWIGGVAAGIAHRLRVDPLLIRGAFVVLTLFGGLSLLLYGVAWALLPEQADGRIHLQEAIRGRFDAALAGAGVFVLLSFTRNGVWFGREDWAPGWAWALTWLGVLGTIAVVVLVVAGANRDRHYRPPTGGPMSTNYPDRPGPDERRADGPEAYPAEPPTAAYPTEPAGQPPTAYPPPPTAYQAPPTAYQAPASYQAPPPALPKPRVPGPGSATVGVVLALCLFAGAGVLLADRVGAFDGARWLTISGISLMILGLGIIVSGLRGRTAGALGGIALVLTILAVPTAAVANAVPGRFDWVDGGITFDGGTAVGDQVWAPDDASEASRGFEHGVGDVTIDLTAVEPDTSGADLRIPVQLGAGEVTVLVPDDAAATVHAQIGAGSVLAPEGWVSTGASGATAPDSTDSGEPGTRISGAGLDVTVRSPQDGPELVIDLQLGLGDVRIEEEAR